MSVFGLVHGGGFGAWCWDQVVSALQERGHSAITVDLTSDDFAMDACHCAKIVSAGFAEQHDLVLVAHSVAGLFTPLVVNKIDVRGLVFHHALLPRPQESVLDQMTTEPDMFIPKC